VPDTTARSRKRWLIALVTVLVAASSVTAAAWVGLLPGTSTGAAEPPATARPPADSDAGGTAATPESGERQAALVETEDERLSEIATEGSSRAGPYTIEPAGPDSLPTTVLTERVRGPYDLPALGRLGAAERQDDGSWLLAHSVIVAKDAELRIEEPGVTLRLASGPTGFASIVAFKGKLDLAGDAEAPLTNTSWEPDGGAPDTDPGDGRAYVRAVGSEMDLTNVDLAELGFWSGRTGGLAWTGSTSAPSTGTATAIDVAGGHYGLFTSRTSDLSISDSTLRDSELDGLLVHRETTGLVTRNITSSANGSDGIAVVRGAQGITLTESTATGNAADGIRIDGTPLAQEANAGGSSTTRATGYSVERSTVNSNAGTGILVVTADGIALTGNTVTGNTDGIVLRGPAVAPELTANTVDATDFAIGVRSGITGARVRGNIVRGGTIGVQVSDSSVDVGANDITASRYAVSLVGEVNGTSVTANRLAGRGLAALDDNRVAVTPVASVVENDVSGWVTDRDEVQDVIEYAKTHPLLWLWLLFLLVPLAARIWVLRRRGRPTPHHHPYRNVAPGPPAAARAPAVQPPTRRPVQHRPDPPVPSGPDRPGLRRSQPVESATTALAQTRVTVVSGKGAAS